MRRNLTLTGISLVLGLAFAAWAHHAPETSIMVTVQDATRDPVPFDHTKHFNAKPELQTNCKQCHHQVENTEAKKEEAAWKCTECHTKDGKEGAIPVKDAMHDKDKGVCRDCHFGSDAEKAMKCNDCHTGGS